MTILLLSFGIVFLALAFFAWVKYQETRDRMMHAERELRAAKEAEDFSREWSSAWKTRNVYGGSVIFDDVEGALNDVTDPAKES